MDLKTPIIMEQCVKLSEKMIVCMYWSQYYEYNTSTVYVEGPKWPNTGENLSDPAQSSRPHD